MLNVYWLLRFAVAPLVGPLLPKVQVGFCSQLSHLIILVGNNMPTVQAVAKNAPAFPSNGVFALAELWASDDDLLALSQYIMTGSMVDTGPFLALRADGTESQRIAVMMRESDIYAHRVYASILFEVTKFRHQPGFAERAERCLNSRKPQQEMLASVRRFAPGGIDDQNARLFVSDTGNNKR